MANKRFEQNQTDMRSLKGAQSVRRKKKRRRSSRTRMVLVATVLAVLAVGVALSLTVFFKIKSVDVSGQVSAYSSKQIINAGDIELESNLIRLDSKAVSKRIEKALPFIEKVEVIKRLPTTVELSVTPAVSAGVIKADNGYATISTKGKILSVSKKKPDKLAVIKGIKLKKAEVATFIENKNGVLEDVDKIYKELGSALSKEITEINLSERINLSFVYRDRVEVKLGSQTELSEKLKFVAILLADSDKIADDDMGIVYATNPKRVSFLRKGSYKEYLAELEKQEAAEQAQKENAENEEESSQNDEQKEQNNEQNSSQSALNSQNDD